MDLRNTIIVMTSNVGARNITEKAAPLGFRDGSAVALLSEQGFDPVYGARRAKSQR